MMIRSYRGWDSILNAQAVEAVVGLGGIIALLVAKEELVG